MPKQPGWLGLKEYGDAVLRSFVVPFGAVFIERCLNTGVFKDSDIPYWWAITVVSFLLGRMLGGLLPVRSQQGPYRRRARHFLLSFLALTALVVGMGYVRKLQGLVILRFFTGLVASLMWSQEEANWNQSAGGRGAAAQEKGGVLLSPATCLGCLVGGVIGGFFFPTGTRVVVQPRPSLLPSVLASVAITLPAFVALTMALGKRRPMHHQRPARKPASHTPTPPRHHHMASTLGNSSSYRSDDGGSLSPMRGGYGGGDVESGGGMGQSIPVNFLRSCNNDRARAWARYQKTLEWRQANRVDSILTRPHPHFDVIKRYYPHYIHCRSLADELVIYEFPGRMDISKLKASGVSPVEMGQHYTFFMEFLFAHLDPREEARIMTVLDIGGISLSMLSHDVLEVLRTTSEIMQSHYPERVVRIVVVNVPFFLGSAWKVIASVLPKSIQDRIELSSDAPKDLRKYISPANLPQAYGGENRQDFGHSPEETELRRVVDRANGNTSEGGGGGAMASSSSSSRPSQPPAPRAYIGASPPPFTVRPTRIATTISTPVTTAHRPPPPPPPLEPASEPPRPPTISGGRATTTTSTTTTTTATASLSSSQSSSPAQVGGGGWKIFRSPFSSAKPKQAFLGYENRYVFDRERQMWVLEDELSLLQQQPQPQPQPQQPTQAPQHQQHPSTHYQASSHEPPLARPSSPPLSDDDAASVEEHGLVLAIQAAHYAERFQRQQQHDHADPRLLGSFGDRQRTLMLNQRGGGGGMASSTTDVAGQYHHPSSEDHHRPPPPSCFLVLQSVSLLVCWSALHVSLEAMVPLWLLTPWHAGGVGLSTRTVGVLACLTALILLAFAMLGPRSLRNLPWTSPLRAFRLSSCLLVLTCLSVIFRPSLPGLLHLTTPFVTVHYLLLLSSLSFSLALGRHASVTLCHMVLKHTVSNPGHVVKFAAAAGQVAGPFVAAFILSWSLQAGLPYPMDSRLIFHAAAILSLALYVLSLTLHINVVGDFGVSGEDDDDAIFGHALASRIWRYIGDAFGLSSYRDFSRVLDDRMQTPRQYYHHKPK